MVLILWFILTDYNNSSLLFFHYIEKELCVKHNTALLEELDKLRKESSTSLELNGNREESNKVDDLNTLYSRNLHLESEMAIMIRKMQGYQNVIDLKNTENQNAIGEVTRLQHCLKQRHTQIDTLERERELESRKRRSMSNGLASVKGALQMNVPSVSRQPDPQAENIDLKVTISFS